MTEIVVERCGSLRETVMVMVIIIVMAYDDHRDDGGVEEKVPIATIGLVGE